jgi:hypothetical protein
VGRVGQTLIGGKGLTDVYNSKLGESRPSKIMRILHDFPCLIAI